MRPLNTRFRIGSTSSKGWVRPSLRALAVGISAVGLVTACSSSPSGNGFSSSSQGGTTVITQTSTSTLADGGTTVIKTSSTSTIAASSGPTSSNGSQSNSSGSSSSSSSTGGGGSDGGADSGDGGFVCQNTDMTKINIDSSGFVCNNQYGISGAWYCYADTLGTNAQNCQMTGVIPFNTTSNAMCISGTTSTSTGTSSAPAFGAGLGFVLNQPIHGNTTKPAYSATSHNIVGFAITVSGNSGGSALNINFPMTTTVNAEAPSVTVPGVSGTSVTYNVLIGNATAADSTTVPAIDATKITSVEVVVPGSDGIAHNYNYCVTSVVPLTAAPAAPASLTAYGPMFNEGKQIQIAGLGPYAVQNDPTNPSGTPGQDQMNMTVMWGGGAVGFTASPTFGDTGNSPGAFPAVVSGWVHNGYNMSVASGGYTENKTIGGLASVKSTWSYTPGNTAKWDAAYDCWFAQNADPINASTELMVWLGHGGSTNPIQNSSGPTAVTITGAGITGSWTVSTGTVTDSNGSHAVISYVSGTNQTSVMGFDLLPFFKDAASHGLASGSTLLGVQAGFELYQQGTWTTNSYTLAIQ